ncbi:hypothetical protein AUM41_19775 [Cronobacter malonaticus]|nr:hypothetical protein [Cronobacter malonaticus]EGT4423140.1 hypothetical protein [Cronobacter malonaticus]EGT4448025.1 hypothetical protein [Cronobacter malonaticus]EGT4456455.1 hypothetical protein [Cronobacter malonaticus]
MGHLSRRGCVSGARSPRSLTDVSSRGFAYLPPCHTTKSDAQAEGAFAPWLPWLRALTPVTYWCKLPGIHLLAALPHHEI